ncbi:MAG: PAS domain S-box protein [Candidatus Pedobacter colombiensis]|uniref:PAS domain S-box protein n=1 Tax=Candidatus Pedobacter colombiensis TaxID=3121371 RepID=A0AAJ5WC85_9SPHI|nr:PAS domain S-box protein [Pedobacter sp.]WEK21620.1 MAG: PAS domain S-box protein [Pedobacter sp.]
MIHSEFYYNLLDKLSIVAITGRSGRIIYVNDKFCLISGFKREELLGSNHRIINANYHPRSFFIDLWKTISSGETWRGEIKNKAKNGTYYWVDTFIIPEKDKNNNILYYYSVRFDITERKRNERELRGRNKELDQIKVLQSHQVRKPVANLLGLIDLVEPEGLNETNKKLFHMFKSITNELDESIRGIVSLENDL